MSRRILRDWVLVPILIATATSLMVGSASAADPVAGTQGIDTSLPPTVSEETESGRDRFAELRVTVNQTRNLTNQAISVTWSGATPTVQGPGRFAAHFIQIMQCWGDDDGSVPSNPGPPPEQCVYGADISTPGGLPSGLYPPGFALSRLISRRTWDNFDPAVGVLEPETTNVWRAFRAVDGTEIGSHEDPDFNPIRGGSSWLNPYFNYVTTNEIGASPTQPNGAGSELFQVDTGVESSGLGCGQRLLPDGLGGLKAPKCWLVVVPRGAPTDENATTPYASQADQRGVATSPLSPGPWANRIAFPLEFNPVDSPCSLGGNERRIAGSELLLGAVISWQPALCSSLKLPPFSFAPIPAVIARNQLVRPTAGSAGLVVVEQPLDPALTAPGRPLVYAPLVASGLVIGFNVERVPKTTAPPEAQALTGVRVAELNLTPRLVAKLLTQSYRGQVDIAGVSPPGYEWQLDNPRSIFNDEDFLQFNPEFRQLEATNFRNTSGLSVPAGDSDYANELWRWIFADQEAVDWLSGEPDGWAMRVNPVYSSDATVNPAGLAFGAPIPRSFPKGDPYCYQAPPRGVNGALVPPLLCGTDWMPWSRSLEGSASATRDAGDSARVVEDPFAVVATSVWRREPRQFLGRRAFLSVTDSASAARLGLQTARLSRAGDNGSDRMFVRADLAGLTAGLAGMNETPINGVLAPQHSSIMESSLPNLDRAANADGYPLTLVTYAVLSPLNLDPTARSDYADFIDYAVGPGQVAGVELGRLPPGYAPLPTQMVAEAREAADLVRAPVTAGTTEVPPTVVPAEPTSPPAMAVPPTPSTESTAPVSQAAPQSPRGPSPQRPNSTPSPDVQSTDVTEVESAVTTSAAVTPAPASLNPSTDSGQVQVATTPATAVARSRYAVAGLGTVALLSWLGVLEITKMKRRPAAHGEPKHD